MLIIWKQDETKKRKKKKSSANPFYFSLIWETIFCMNINTMADIWLVQKKSEAIWREKKKNVPFLLYLYISKYLLKYVLLLILLTIKGFLNKNLSTCFWTLSRLLDLNLLLSVTRLKDLCDHSRKSIKNCKYVLAVFIACGWQQEHLMLSVRLSPHKLTAFLRC